MIPFTNATISTYRLTVTSGESAFVVNLTGKKCYIQPKEKSVTNSFDSQGAFKEYIVMMDGTPDIIIGDKLVDANSLAYYVDAVGVYKDLTGNRTELIAKIIYD